MRNLYRVRLVTNDGRFVKSIQVFDRDPVRAAQQAVIIGNRDVKYIAKDLLPLESDEVDQVPLTESKIYNS